MKRSHSIVSLAVLASIGYAQTATAQVTADGTVGSIVGGAALNFTIDGGTRSGNNLFHSFSQFSVPTGGSAIFNNATDVQNIFGRVTGSQLSNIDGILKTQGGTNLFLMNPNGIMFGPNAQLQLGGSFLGTTASSMKFTDGIEFSTVTSTPALLSVNLPLGLQMGTNPGHIRVEGQGHKLLHSPSFLFPIVRDPVLTGLRVQPGKTLALLGNGLQLAGGVLIAESGQVELGSGRNGLVTLDLATPQWKFGYAALPTLADIQLTHAALVDVSGSPGGSIHVQGKAVLLQDSSLMFVQHQGSLPSGFITIDADSLELSGVLPNKDASSVLSENLGRSAGANIDVSARKIVALDGGKLITTTFQQGGAGGNITVDAAESIDIVGYSRFSPTETSGISTPSNAGGGRGGNIVVHAPTISIQDGAGIGSLVLEGAGGGQIQIHADNLKLIGENKGTAGGSFIAASTLKGGDAGSIDIQTGILRLQGGGVISASTSGSSNAGRLTIQARESLEVDGSGSVVSQSSRITASGQKPPGRFQQLFGLAPLPSGNAGNLSITSPIVQVRNQGYIAAENVGSGNAGRLTLNANSIKLDRQGAIRTLTTVGNGGNLELTVRDSLILRNNSLISAKAGGQGTGGNVILNSPIIVGLENSDVIAQSERGRGGNITITTQGIIGLTYRTALTAENDITASSEFGINGNVQVNTIGINPTNALNTLPVDIVDSSRQMNDRCAAAKTGSFVSTGRGGIPKSPIQTHKAGRTWNDLRNTESDRSPLTTVTTPIVPVPTALIEASALRTNLDGSIELVTPTASAISAGATCALQ